MAQKKSVIGAAAFFLVVTLVVGYSTIAAEIDGDKKDPLVTLSYLEGLTPDFEKTISEVVAEKTDEQLKSIDTRIDQISQDLLELQTVNGGSLSDLAANEDFIASVAARISESTNLPAAPSGGGSASSYKKVEIEAGKSVELEMGSSFFLRVGSATCMAPGDPGLIDLTGGSALSNGETVEPNHLYTVTVASERGFKTSENVTVFIMGKYTAG